MDALTADQEGQGLLLKLPDPDLRAQYETAKEELEAVEKERKRLDGEGLPTIRATAQQAILSETLGALEGRMRLGREPAQAGRLLSL